MLSVLAWYLALSVVGLAALPLTMRLLRALPDRGVPLARPLGLLLWAYGFWLLVSLGLLRNSTAATVLVLSGLGFWSARIWRREGAEMLAYLRRNARALLVVEGLFLAALAAYALFRAYNPDIAFTEKPMEFGFTNAILRSPDFPPRDPWLSGYGISYYYLGYVMVTLLTRLSGLASDVTFNLTQAALFALTVTGAYSLVSNLVQAERSRAAAAPDAASRASAATGLLGAGLVALVGNLVGVLEMVRARGWGSERLWAWLDVRNLGPSDPSPTWYPQDGWWWWRASRVIHDRDSLGNSMEVISEFPFFSFLLGDVHPHVLALPFVLLAISLALSVLLHRNADAVGRSGELSGLAARWRRLVGGLWPGWAWDVPLWGLALGALAFLNTWDYPIYLSLFVVAYAVRHGLRLGRNDGGWLADVVSMGGLLLGLGLLLFAPFYLGFRSQAGGIGLVGEIKTRPHQYLLMFGIQYLFLAALVPPLGWRALRGAARGGGASVAAWVAGGILVLAALGCALAGWWTAALALAVVALAAFTGVWGARLVERDDPLTWRLPPSALLALGMTAGGLLLTVVVEFIFLRDTFGTRMNTVFKFYYQAWVLTSLAGAYGAWRVLAGWRCAGLRGRVWRGAWTALATLGVLAGLTYTLPALVSKADAFRATPTLDGTRYVARYRPDEYAAIAWLRENAPPGAVLLEAPGGAYTEYNWVSAHTGVPTVLGWGGHQLQWRGSYDEPARREPDIATIYQSADSAVTARLLEAYGVDYVVLGPRERDRYGVTPQVVRLFDSLMVRAHEGGSYTIYSRRG